MGELVEVYDVKGDFLFSTADETELERLWKNAVDRGFHPVIGKEIDHD